MITQDFTLLFVEDDADTRERMRILLEDDLKAIYLAADGEEGWQQYKKIRPDIVLTDVNMPRLDGLSMAERIKSIDPERPILVITAFDDKEILLRAIEAGIDSFITKPIDMEKLQEKLEETARTLHERREQARNRASELESLYQMAHFDTLTKIPNRFLFETNFNQAISRAKRNGSSVTLFLIDLDNFKQINDTHGHLAGDRILQHVADNIRQIVRHEDTFARLGGDEFALIVEGIHRDEDIEALAQKIVEAATRPLEYRGHALRVSCSVGVGRYPQDGTTPDTVFHCADTAMYHAKERGKSCYRLYWKLDAQSEI